jgi:hypothetical protein
MCLFMTCRVLDYTKVGSADDELPAILVGFYTPETPQILTIALAPFGCASSLFISSPR